MISVAEAKKLINSHSFELPSEKTSLSRAAGRIIAADVYATVDIPNFPQSSMDGYALSYQDYVDKKDIYILGEMAAGSSRSDSLQQGTAIRIFTGAAVPGGADTVVMQEKTTVENGKLKIHDADLKQGDHVRLKGSEVKEGTLALIKGHRINPASIGFLAGFGITELDMYRDPIVKIIVTGDELQKPGESLSYGQVYESNSFALTAALQQSGLHDIQVFHVGDNLEALKNILHTCLGSADIVLLTGGVSVGDYDFTLKAAELCGIETVFHKIRQRPGKPIYFGSKDHVLVFGLPGNPASVLTCYYEYVANALEKMSHRHTALKTTWLPLTSTYKKSPGLTHFLKGHHDGKTVSILNAQESYRLHSFARANCLIQIDEELSEVQDGEVVEVHCLPV